MSDSRWSGSTRWPGSSETFGARGRDAAAEDAVGPALDLPARRLSEAPITQRKRIGPTPVAAFLDELLESTWEALDRCAVDEASEIVLHREAQALLNALAHHLPGVRLGARLLLDGARVVVVGASAASGGRLFPDLLEERILDLVGAEGSSLHAGFDGQIDEEHASEASTDAMLERLGLALSQLTRQIALTDRARRDEAAVRTFRAQLIQADKLAVIGQNAASIVHELNNPLTSILAYADFLRRKQEAANGDAQDIDRLARIGEAAERILRFSRDLTAFSRPSLEVPKAVPIHAIIDRSLGFCEHVFHRSGVIAERVYGESAVIEGVADQLTQVFVNLFTNACQAMSGGGRLAVTTSVSTESRRVSIRVRDEGHGILAEHMATVFDPFFTTRADGSGTGLGLSIVANIVRGHSGTIRVEHAVPRGCVFVIELPVLRSA